MLYNSDVTDTTATIYEVVDDASTTKRLIERATLNTQILTGNASPLADIIFGVARMAVASADIDNFFVSSGRQADSDGDGLLDTFEIHHGFNPLVVDNLSLDSDSDGLTDLFEASYGLDPATTDESAQDPDADTLNNLAEQAAGTNPNDADSDHDGVNDNIEITNGSDPTGADAAVLIDTDGDGLPDAQELLLGSNVSLQDSDGDGFTDLDEVNGVSNPGNSDDIPTFAPVKLLSSDSQTESNFGSRVDITDDFAVVAATTLGIFSDETSGGERAAYVYWRQASGNWLEVARLKPRDLTNYENFARDVAIDNNFLVIGSPDRGATGGIDIYQLTPATGAVEYHSSFSLASRHAMGARVAISFDDNGAGIIAASTAGQYDFSDDIALLRYESVGNSWGAAAICAPQLPLNEAGDDIQYFQAGVTALDINKTVGSLQLVAALNTSSNDVLVATFEHLDNSARCTQTDLMTQQSFSNVDSVALSDSVLLLGTSFSSEGGNSAGKIEFFNTTSSGGWSFERSDIGNNVLGNLGFSAATNGRHSFVGAIQDSTFASLGGSVFIYDLQPDIQGSFWSRSELRSAPDVQPNDRFGSDVAMSDNYVIIGAGATSATGLRTGSAYIYKLDFDDDGLVDSLDPDNDNDGMPNDFEIAKGLNPYDATDALGDLDSDGFNNEREYRSGTDPDFALDTPLARPRDHFQMFGSSAQFDSYFGLTLEVDSGTAMVGAPGVGGSYDREGAIDIYDRDGDRWNIVQTLRPSDYPGQPFSLVPLPFLDYSFFAWGADLEGDRLVAGTLLWGYYIYYQRIAGVWQAQDAFGQFTFPNGETDGGFSSHLLLNDDRVFVSEAGKSTSIAAGRVHIHSLLPAGITEETIVVPAACTNSGDLSDPCALNGFGTDVSYNSNRLLVGAPDLNLLAPGSAYIFTESSTDANDFSLDEKLLLASDGTLGDAFGTVVAIEGDRAMIAAPNDNDGGAGAGSVYVFEYQSGSDSWLETHKIQPASNQAGDKFGIDMELRGDSVWISAIGANNAGLVYQFNYNAGGNSWDEAGTYVANDIVIGDEFGSQIARDGDVMLVGSLRADAGGENTGKVYAFFDDADNDDIGDLVDNCPMVSNTPQGDNDGDGLGDVCDLDDDVSPLPGFGFLDITLPSVDVTPQLQYLFQTTVGYQGPNALCYTIQNAPGWLVFNAATGAMSGTPSNDDFGLASGITITASEALTAPATDASSCVGLVVAGGQSFSSIPFDLNVQDSRAPTVLATPDSASGNTVVPVTLSCIETIGSGCAEIYYAFDSTASTASTALGIGPLGTSGVVAVANSTTLHFIAVDNAGNISEEGTAVFAVDAIAPTISLDNPVSGSLLGVRPLISGSAGDLGDSGFDRIDIQLSGSDGKGLNASGTNVVPGSNEVVTLCSGSCPSFSLDTDSLSFAFTDNASYTISVTAYDNAGNSSSDSASFQYYGSAAQFTTLDLNLSSNSVLFNGELDAAIKLTVPGDTGADLSGQNVSLTITPPVGSLTAPIVLSRQTNTDGQVTFSTLGDGTEVSFNEKGAWAIEASYSGVLQYSSSSSNAEVLLVGTSAGYAVLIQGRAPTSEGLDSHNKTLNRVYDTLKRRNFADQNIFYFNYDAAQDVDGDGVPDNIFADGKGIDADVDLVGKAGIQNQIQNLYFAMNANPAPLYIVMIDHGNTNGTDSEFLLANSLDGNVSITPTELDSWLDSLEANLSGGAELEPRVIINGSCYSGGFIEPLTGINGTALASPRVVISSAAADEVSYKGPLESDGIRVGEYFIEELFEFLDQGDNLLDAFTLATQKTEIFTREADNTVLNGEFLDTAVQHPLLEDNSDGIGSNFIESADTSNAADGNVAKNLFLGTSVQSATNSLAEPAAVIRTNETIILPAGTALPQDSTVTLLLEANDNAEVSVAFVEIRSPATALQGGDLSGSGVTEQLEADALTRIFLDAPNTNGCAVNEFCKDEASFTTPGKYELYYYVEDQQTGAVSPAARALVYKRKGAEIAPAAFDLATPVSGDTVNVEAAIFQWQSSSDTDGVSYTLRLCEDNALTLNCRVIEEIAYNFVAVQALQDVSTYYWAVDAIDSAGAVTSSTSVFNFTTAFDGNNIVGVVQGFVQSSTDFSFLSTHAVTRAGVAAEYATATTDNGGVYVLLTLAGNVSIEASAMGFESQSKAVTIPAGAAVTNNFALAVAAPPTDTDMDGDPDVSDPDDDNDGMPDSFENLHVGLNPLVDDAAGDLDGDGLTNLEEFLLGLDPNVVDNGVQVPMPPMMLWLLSLCLLGVGRGVLRR